MANPILVTGAAGRVGAIGRTVTELLLKQGKAVRAMVRNEDERAQALRDMGAEVVVGDLLDLDSMHRVIAGCETMYFSMSISDAYLAATINTAAVAKHHGVKAFISSKNGKGNFAKKRWSDEPLVLSCMYFKTRDVAGLRIFYCEAGDPSKPTFEVCRLARG